MTPANERGETPATGNPDAKPSDDEISDVAEGGTLNPKDHHPPNAEPQGVKTVLSYSTLAAVVAMVVIAIIAFSVFG